MNSKADSMKQFPYVQAQVAKYETVGHLWDGRKPYQNQPVLFKYVATRNVSASSITLGIDRISMNSVYDPEITYSGH